MMTTTLPAALQVWQRACAVALATLPGMTPVRLQAVLQDVPPEIAWNQVADRSFTSPELARICGSAFAKVRSSWSKAARRTDPMELLEHYEQREIGVWTRFTDYPADLESDPAAPAVLFWAGNRSALDHPRVAIVGTRHCSPEGKKIAYRFGNELAELGISVVSGLAIGIDGAAHDGAFSAFAGPPPIGVVGSGLDVVYPKRHSALWQRVAAEGLMISEAPLGTPPEHWRFPARNRIIAAVSDIVVVIESHERGGSLITAEEALARNVTLVAVPGSINNPAASGTNALIQCGAAEVVLCVEDIVGRLPLLEERLFMDDAAPLEPSDPVEAMVLSVVGWELTSTEEVMTQTGMALSEVAKVLTRLELAGWIISGGIGWWQRQNEANFHHPEE